MKTIENVTIYKCDFCKKELKRKHAMVNHEIICYHNPINKKACYGCAYLTKKKVFVSFEKHYNPEYGTDYVDEEKEVFQCTKFGKLMFPWSIERKGLQNIWSTFEDQEAMPKSCDGFYDGYSF